jgi:hypothetical protein
MRRRAETLAFLSLLFHLDETFPSQSTFYRHRKTMEALDLDWDNIPLKWVSSLRSAVNSRNYARCDAMTGRRAILEVCGHLYKPPSRVSEVDIIELAVCRVLDSLRLRMGRLAWSTLRAAYRGMSLSAETDTDRWWMPSLLFTP